MSKLSHYNPIIIGIHNLVWAIDAPCTAAVKQYSTAGVDEPFISKTTYNIEQKPFLDKNFLFCEIHQNIDQKFNSPIQFAASQRLGVRQLLTLVLCILSFFSLW